MSVISRSHFRILRTKTVERLYLRYYQNAAPASEYSETPTYPKIIDQSQRARLQRKKEIWYEQITNLGTVEQKLMELNMPKYYGYWSLRFSDNQTMLLGNDFCRYATRTHLVEGLPAQYYDDVRVEAEALTPLFVDKVEQLIDLNFNNKLNRRFYGLGRAVDRHHTQNFLFGLHRILAGTLAFVPHIKEATVDLRPRVEAFWFLGGIPPDRLRKLTRKNNKHTKDLENDPIERPIQGTSTPFLGLRTADGLPDVVTWDDPLATSAPVIESVLDPRSYGYKFKIKHATTVTGFWPGERQEHNQFWLHTREFFPKIVQEFGEDFAHDALRQKMVVASFTQALAHATYLGFGPVTELTYPMVQQSAISDGQRWNLSLYQLNTCALHSHLAQANPRNNILWLGEEEKLFEAVEDGGVKELNTSLLSSIISMYLKKGVPRNDPTPYLGPQKRLHEHPACEEYRGSFLSCLHNLLSNRPRHKLRPEIYLWEKIYKVDHKMRPYESPRRFFEPHFNQQHPGLRRLNDYDPIYIPKALRKDKWIKHKPKLNTEHLYKYD